MVKRLENDLARKPEGSWEQGPGSGCPEKGLREARRDGASVGPDPPWPGTKASAQRQARSGQGGAGLGAWWVMVGCLEAESGRVLR